ncbi:MAG: SPOR domain-containing protein [Candidatus Omnitrophica bacterium]|nr:SPOR domain-containing protein [Candidatus Omnitrophota bacterium]
MNYKNREVQPELFCKINKKQSQNLLNKNIFCSHFKSAISVSIDTLIVIIIGVLMINLSAFVLGIEKGKCIAKNQDCKTIAVQPAGNAAVPMKQKKQNIIPVAIEEKAPEEKLEINVVEEKQIVENAVKPADGYIIQLVTYSSDTSANKEASRLNDQGLGGHVLKSGEYYIVYAGTYNSKMTAKEKLGKFKERYKDCFVRLLKKS